MDDDDDDLTQADVAEIEADCLEVLEFWIKLLSGEFLGRPHEWILEGIKPHRPATQRLLAGLDMRLAPVDMPGFIRAIAEWFHGFDLDEQAGRIDAALDRFDATRQRH